MPFQLPPIASDGDTIDAIWMNTYIRDNFQSGWPFTAAGDMAYAMTGNFLTRLAKPTGRAMMVNDGSVPSWLDIGSAGSMLWSDGQFKWLSPGTAGQIMTMFGGAPAWRNPDIIHASGVINNVGTTQNTSSSDWQDVSGASVNLTLTRTCAIIAFGSMVGYAGSGGGSYNVSFTISIDGTNFGDFRTYTPYPGSIGVGAMRANVGSGTRNVKIRFCSPFGIPVYSYGGYVVALAISQ